jgi:hypothetical protein
MSRIWTVTEAKAEVLAPRADGGHAQHVSTGGEHVDARPSRPRVRAIVLIALAGLSVGLGACGNSGKAMHSAESRQRSSQPFLGDGDFDVGDGDPDNNWDTDEDAPFDYYNRKNYSWNRGVFHDRDDTEKVGFGRAADGADAQVISRVVTRYYRAASRDDGRGACAMLIPEVANTIADYRRTGIDYLRGSGTCSVAMKRLFQHERMTVPEVTSVRMGGNVALVLWGSRTMPAGYITLERRHGTWVVTAPVGYPLL